MIKYSFLPFLIFFSFNISGQVSISGQIKNAPDSSEITITHFNNSFEFEEITLGRVKPDKDGNFTLTFNLDKPREAKFLIAEQYTDLYLEPKDSLFMSLDYSRFDETLRYSGRGAANNQYMAADLLANFNMQAQMHRPFDNADTFALFMDSLERENQLFLKANFSSEFTPEFRDYITATTKYRYIYPRCMYQVGFDPATNSFYNKPVPDNYYDFLKTMDLNDQKAADNSRYQSALEYNYIHEMYSAKIEKEIHDSLSDTEKAELRATKGYQLRKQLFKEKILDYQLTSFMKSNIVYYVSNMAFLKGMMDDYRLDCKNPEFIAIIDKIFERANTLAPGKPAPDFTLVNKDGKQVSLSSLKGKVVYIDFWATWCGPCMAEMPRSHDLMEKFKKRKDVVFLYVNVSDDRENWKKYIEKEKMKGMNLFADEVQSGELYKLYNFSGIPHYVLIDRKGNLISANASRPGYAEKIILEALK